MEIKRKHFLEYYQDAKGPFVFIVSSSLTVILILLFATPAETNLKHLSIIIGVWTLLIAGILYSAYAQYRKVVSSIKDSGVLNYLTNQGFEPKEKTLFINYELTFEGRIENCFIVAVVTKGRGFPVKYYLHLLGINEESVTEMTTDRPEKIELKAYGDAIPLTPGPDTKSKLEDGIIEFIGQLRARAPK